MRTAATAGTILRYLFAKLAAAGAGWIGFVLLAQLASGLWDPYNGYQLLRNDRLAGIFLVYGTACSVAIDAIGLFARQEDRRRVLKTILYIVAAFGYAVYVAGWSEAIVPAGLIGSLLAVVCYAAFGVVVRRKRASIVLGAFVLLAWIGVNTFDYNGVKKGWHSTRAERSYSASYRYFHGTYRIPIKLTPGGELRLRVKENEEEGHLEYSVADPSGGYVPSREENGVRYYRADQGGTYRLVFTAYRAKGSLQAEWSVS